MSSESSDWGMGPRPEEDLEYDLAHDAAGGGLPEGGSGDGDDVDASGLTYVATETPDYSGDYSYDLSHDVPGR